MQLKHIYKPIKKELDEVENVLNKSLKNTTRKSIHEICNYMGTGERGKKIRPALVLLSAKASMKKNFSHSSNNLIKIAAAIELIHIASLVHDDVIDHSNLRHNKSTINVKYGPEVSIALGDYIYSVAFELISKYGNKNILKTISSATKLMCEGELFQVCERDNFSLSKETYMLFIKNKTAALFASSCHAGSIFTKSSTELQNALKEYGLNFGAAFQIIDDYLDLMGNRKQIGKNPGQDVKSGEVTLPVLNLLSSVSDNEKNNLRILLAKKNNNGSLKQIKSKVFHSNTAINETKKSVKEYLNKARENLKLLSNSEYKESLFNIIDLMMKRGFHDKC